MGVCRVGPCFPFIRGFLFINPYALKTALKMTAVSFLMGTIPEPSSWAQVVLSCAPTSEMFNRPGVAGAVLQTPVLLINSFSQSVSQ